MVSSEKVWDPLHAGLFQSYLSEQRLTAGLPPIVNIKRSAAKDTACRRSQKPSPLSSPRPSVAAGDTPHSFQALPQFHPPVRYCDSSEIEGLHKSVPCLRVACQPEEEEKEDRKAEHSEMKVKRHVGRAETAMEDRLEDMADGPKNAKITLSFPLSAAPLPTTLTSPNRCRSSSSSSPSPHRRRPSSKSSDEGSLWKLDATMDIKHRQFKPPRHGSSPSSSPSSSSSPMTVHGFMRKDIKSPPPLKCSKLSPETLLPRSPTNGPLGVGYGVDGWDERHRLANGTASPSAQILFSLGTSAYQRAADVDRREKMPGRPAGKVASPHLSLHPPTLHLPSPIPPPPPPPSEGLTAPTHPSSFPPPNNLKPELICGVCHRLFSSASSLTVHMRLHRGSRALSCRYCGKVFIHSKRLQSHEASCGVPSLPSNNSLGPPPLTVQPKEEPLEEGEVRVEGGVFVGGTDISKARPGKKARSFLARIQGDDAAAAEILEGDENHFVKVVDGNVIYFCSVCERSYMTLSSLKRHSNVHSWRRRYPCHYCDKVFALAEYRTKHEVWHTGERRYQCIFCWDAFATYYNLKTHQKAIHGINPNLISSEKTANGGYKQKTNALKLYRLLPMRSRKRPYKTYSDSLHNGLLLPPADAPSLALPGLGCSLGPGDLQSFIRGPHPVKPDPDAFPDGFPVSLDVEHRNLSALAPLPQADMPQIRKHDIEAHEPDQGRGSGSFKTSSSSKTKTSKSGRGVDAGMPSVITYGHSKPSVIVHGTAMSSSVIVHSNQITSAGDKSLMSSPPSENSRSGGSQTSHKSGPRSLKVQREGADSHRKRARDSSDPAEEPSVDRHDGEAGKAFHRSRKSHGRNDVSGSKLLSASAGPQAKEAGPLCQITVRIGEEAIVKRSISETDLKRDKGHSPPKAKRSETSSARDAKEPRHSHSHHHHKHKIQHAAGLETRGGEEEEEEEEEEEVEEEEEEEEGEEEGEVKKKKSQHEVREYYFRQEVREQESDHDTQDNLWRPYYSYKPKRKAQAHLQRVKSWQRKLKFKRSIQLKRRGERLKNHADKDADKSLDEEEDGKSEAPEKLSAAKHDKGEVKDKKDSISSPLRDRSKGAEEKVKEPCRKVSGPPLLPPKLPLSTSVVPARIKRRPWTNGNAAECGTCGRWFSSPRKRDKHELSHLLEFVCLFCRATFPSRDKLEDHQRAQHPKPTEAPSAPPKAPLGEQVDRVGDKSASEVARNSEEKGGRVNALGSNSSPTRLSRRALSRHTCPQCHKVCKTSSALNRHIRRHDLSSSPEREKEDNDPEPKTTETAAPAVGRGGDGKKEEAPTALSVSVISYSTSDPPNQSACSSPQQHQDQQRQASDTGDQPGLPGLENSAPEKKPGPPAADPPAESAVDVTPAQPDYPAAALSTLQSVLVMNGSECLDCRIPSKKNLDGQMHRLHSPVHAAASANTSPNVPMTSQTRITAAAAPVSMTTAHVSEGGFMKRDGVIVDRERHRGSGLFARAGYEEPPQVQDLRVSCLSRSPSPNEAQDLTMSSILAREREVERQREKERELERQKERDKDVAREREKENERHQQMSRVAHTPEAQVALLVPKEEPLSPMPSPQHIPTQTTMNGPSSHRHTPKSPCRPPSNMGLLAQASSQVHSSSQGMDRLTLPMGAAGVGDRPSAHALLLPRAPQPPDTEQQDSVSSRDPQQGSNTPVSYPAQNYPMPLIVPDGYHSGKKQEENLLMSSYPGALSFGTLGKIMVPNGGDLAKLPFYPDPYQLLYGPQLLAYPYNLAALPVALNMMAPGGDKVEPLPFLPTIFNYAATAGPYMGSAPHPLVANPSLYNGGGGGGGGSSKKQRDSSSGGKP